MQFSASNYNPGSGGIGTVGLASQGTQITFGFAGVQAGVSLLRSWLNICLTGTTVAGTPPACAVLVGSGGAGGLTRSHCERDHRIRYLRDLVL